MNQLLIMLSSGGGEAIFIGALIGLAMWGFVSLDNKMRANRRAKKEDERLKYLKENIVDKGGLSKILPKLFAYFESTYGLTEAIEVDGGSFITNEQYTVAIMLFGNHYETLEISIENTVLNKKVKGKFQISDSQESIISTMHTLAQSKSII